MKSKTINLIIGLWVGFVLGYMPYLFIIKYLGCV